MTHQVVLKLSVQGRYGCYKGPESRVWEQPDVAPCTHVGFHNALIRYTNLELPVGPPRPIFSGQQRVEETPRGKLQHVGAIG